MRWKLLINGLSRHRTGIALLSGAATLLEGVERALSTRPAVPRTPDPVPALEKPCRTSYFTIKQTRSELGYVYWVLQGFGCYQSFALFDTWREAMDAAQARVEASRAEEKRLSPEPVLMSAHA